MKMKKIATISLVALSLMFVSCSSQTKTIENLQIAIASETNNIAKYSKFAERAEIDSLPNIALLFKVVARSESIHKQNHIAELKKMGLEYSATADEVTVDSTRGNLYRAKAIEEYEVMSLYYEMVAVATKEKATSAAQIFSRVMAIEERHARYFIEAIEILQSSGTDSALNARWAICAVCGDTHKRDAAPSNCGLCGASSDTFLEG